VSTLDVITVENTLLSNELALLSIQTRQRTSKVQLIKALGGGWQNTQLPDAKNLP
jgi:outer membrane protein TolC